LLALTSGTLVALLISLTASWEYIVLTGWDCAIVVLFCLVIYSSYPMDQGRHTKKVILKEGIRYPLIDAFVVFSSAVCSECVYCDFVINYQQRQSPGNCILYF